jgi:hypothetical protein
MLFAALTRVWPPAVPAGGTVRLYGYPCWWVTDSCDPTKAVDGDLSCIGAIMVGDFICSARGDAYTMPTNWARFNSNWLYQLSCQLAGPQQGATGAVVSEHV